MEPLKLQSSKHPALLVQLQLSSFVSPMVAGHRRTASFPVLNLWSGKPQRSRVNQKVLQITTWSPMLLYT
jgi:hypothetical protein